MARRSSTDRSRGIPPRIAALFLGGGLGLAWGSLMWLVAGRGSGASGWLYIALTMAMIGGGVAAIFGAAGARKRGERVLPRIRLGRRDRAR